MRESHRDWLPAQVYQHNSQIEPSVDVLEVSVVQPLMLFPNPVSSDDPIISLLGIAEEDYGKMGTLFVHSINDGVIVSDEINCEEQIAFNIMDDLPGGIYVIILRTERNTYSGKLIMR